MSESDLASGCGLAAIDLCLAVSRLGSGGVSNQALF